MYYLFEIIRYVMMLGNICGIAITFACGFSFVMGSLLSLKVKVEGQIEGVDLKKATSDIRKGILKAGLYNLAGCGLLFIPLEFLHNLVNPY